jgi:hypothetical protein
MGEFTNTKKHRHARSVSRDFIQSNKENDNFIVLRDTLSGADVIQCINKNNERAQDHHLIVDNLN